MYKKEDLKFFNMKKILTLNNKEIFEIEDELTIEEKIAFIDGFKDGIATYLIDLIEKFHNEKENLQKDSSNKRKTINLRMWISKNDKRGILDNNFYYGRYRLFKNHYNIEDCLTCPCTSYNKELLYTGEHIVNQWFHDLCQRLYLIEKNYIEANDTFLVKIKKVKSYAKRYGGLNNSKIDNIIIKSSGYKDYVTEEELDIIIESFEEIELNIDKISDDLNSKISGGYEYKIDVIF